MRVHLIKPTGSLLREFLVRNTPSSCHIRTSVRSISVSSRRHRVVKSKYADVEISDKSYFEFVWSGVHEFGDRTALVDGLTGRSLTYAESRARALSMGSELRRRGAEKGDVMAIFLPNCVEYPLIFSGANAAGVANTTLNPIYTPPEVCIV